MTAVSEISSIHQAFAGFSILQAPSSAFHTDLFSTLINHLLGLTDEEVFASGQAALTALNKPNEPYICQNKPVGEMSGKVGQDGLGVPP